MGKCLCCYKELEKGQVDYHPSCAKKIFHSTEIPLLPYSKSDIYELAKQVIKSKIAVTGVQPKLSVSTTVNSHTSHGVWTVLTTAQNS